MAYFLMAHGIVNRVEVALLLQDQQYLISH